MKKIFAIFMALVIMLSVCAMAETPRVMLLKVYRQIGWGNGVQAAAVDEEGGMWYYSAEDGSEFPVDALEQIEFLQSCGGLEKTGTLDAPETERLYYLTLGLQDAEVQCAYVANDAGEQKCSAIVYQGEETRVITLGISGDDLYENTDPGAQELYRVMGELFPNVKDYQGEEIAPKGFQAVTIQDLFGLTQDDLQSASIKAYAYDCEEGSCEIDCDIAMEEFLSKKVTGKENCASVTGGTTIYGIYDAEGNSIASVEFYNGLLVMQDGMYRVE